MYIFTEIEPGLLYIAAAGLAVYALSLLYIYSQSRRRYLKYFALHAAFLALAPALILLNVYEAAAEAAGILIYSGLTAAGLALLAGVRDYFDLKVARLWFYISPAVIGVAAAGLISDSPLPGAVSVSVFMGLIYLRSGSVLLRSGRTKTVKGTGAASIVLSSGIFLMPWLHQLEWLFSPGYVILGTAGPLFLLGVLGMHYEDLQREILQLQNRELLNNEEREKIRRLRYLQGVIAHSGRDGENSRGRMEMLLSESPAVIYSLQADDDGFQFTFLSDNVQDILGYSPEKFKEDTDFWREGIHPEDKGKLPANLERLERNDYITIEEYRYQDSEGSYRWLHDQQRLVEHQDGSREVIGAWWDITERRETERMLKIREEQYRKIFEMAPVGVMLEDSEGKILDVNKKLCQMSGYEREKLVGSSVFDTLTPDKYEEEARKNLQKVMAGEDIEFTGTSHRKSGERYYVRLNETKVRLPGDEEGLLSIQLDLTELKEKEEKLKYLSYHDGLTDLYNRSYLEEEMERLNTERQLPLSIIMCDVNGLKMVNDTYGHSTGDELLQKVADILLDNTRQEDIVARWAGDEFVIFLPRTDRKSACEIGERIEKACEEVDFRDDIPVTLGLGVATKSSSDDALEDLLTRADERMYRDKLTKSSSLENRLVQNMLNTLAAKSAETREHAVRMRELARRLGETLGLTDSRINDLDLVASLHDIGKATISEEILTKAGDLSEDEWQKIKKHSERGYNIAAATEEFAPIAREILYHHEHWDGGGYPRGLAGEDIPLLARIIAVVDAYDVMTHDRPYKEAVSGKEALQELKKCSGSQFDPELVKTFVDMMKEENVEITAGE